MKPENAQNFNFDRYNVILDDVSIECMPKIIRPSHGKWWK